MTTKPTCGECGAELPANAPQGLCPRCLAGMGLGLLPTEVLPKSDFVIERTGTMIGRYKLLEKIGEGGFGVVYMAEQVEPVQRKVAIKIVKAGMDTKEVIARFEAERQAIALMDHPNIARALDAGATEAGRPYFVMELVRGIPITEYCDQANLPTRERLQLFMKVCQAVQHAHQKGVIHRDLKPSNVLVTELDGEPVPKVIDFGVAKALGQKLTAKTLFTAFNHMIGTPAYMSPEQAALSGMDIDTRADIYSLGVLLYELLTGVTPFDAEIFRKEAMDEIRRMIRETEPPKPSTRLQTLGEKFTEVAKRRDTEPAGLSRLVRGDLDWIVMKCLEKDRKRRYETANGLAADVARHLDSEPVMARPQSNFYRFQKLVRRHKLAFAAAGGVIAALIIVPSVSIWLFFKVKEASERAIAAEKKQTKLRLRAEGEAEKARHETIRADQALAQEQIRKAEQFFAANDYSTALAYLARVLRQNPTNVTVVAQVFSHLTRHNFIVPLTEPLKHDGAVRYAQFSPDGQRVVTASWDGTARVWNVLTGEPITPPLQHNGKVNRAQFDSTGTRVITASDDTTARVWNAETGQLLITIEHSAAVGDACFSPDGELAFTATTAASSFQGAGQRGRTWDARNGRPLSQPFGVGNTFRRVLRPFSPDGRKYVSTTDSAAIVWDSKTGEQLVRLTPLDGGAYIAAEFCPNGLYVVTSGKTARVWDAQTGLQIGRDAKEDGPIYIARLSADGERLLTVSTTPDKTAQVWNANTGRALTGPVKIGWSKTAQFSPNGQWVLSAGLGHVRLWDAITGQFLTEPIEQSGLWWGELSQDGERLVTASQGGYATVWSIRMGYGLASPVSLPIPEWVSRFLEALAGKLLSEQGIAEPVQPDQLRNLRRQLTASSASDPWTRWGKWLFSGASPQATVHPEVDAAKQAAAADRLPLIAMQDVPLTTDHPQVDLVKQTAADDPLPLIMMQDVPLLFAIGNLARQANLNFTFDSRVTNEIRGADGRIVPQPTVNIRWENLTARQALTTLLTNHNLILVEDPQTQIARIMVEDTEARTEKFPAAMKLVGKPVPKAFKLPLLAGGEIELPPATNHGPLLLDFCASWCKPSRETMPVLADIAKEYSARGVRYVAVNQDEAPEKIRSFLARAKLDITVALDKKCGMAGAFRVTGIPTIVVVDRSNIIRYVQVGAGPELGAELRRALEEVLKAESGQGQSALQTDGNGNPSSANGKK
jgi:serine/threonine protein kinase/WD40 repeat protein/thiol-disulfide isomerase/thioredoxin